MNDGLPGTLRPLTDPWWDEDQPCDYCTDRLPRRRTYRIIEYRVCLACLEFMVQQVKGRAEEVRA